MSSMSSVVTLATAGAEKLRELPMSPYAFGAIAFASFLALLGLLWTFRNTATKYDTPIRVRHDDSSDLPGAPGASGPGAHH